uniref:3-oxoacyl-[acyl-carrier-protein] reductase FabG-like n=1 Tax=Nelumbo nucifera TaxID=4432 RepID=A0A822ZGQ2_NELNU|nr:TPA_asm: hypothetical protein HUJ06_000446 [Nelumbo nucifera]
MAGQGNKILEPWHRLDRKVVMVTGASSGLGRDFCLDLAKAGCKVVAAARRKDRLKSLCDEINQLGSTSSSSENDSNPPSLRAVAVDLDLNAKGPVIEASVQKAWDAFGRIDALINNAGVRGGAVTSLLDFPEDEWNNIVTTNLTGTWLVSKYIGRCMSNTNQKGSIINVTSIAGLNRGQLPGGVAYVASKAGLNALTKVRIN